MVLTYLQFRILEISHWLVVRKLWDSKAAMEPLQRWASEHISTHTTRGVKSYPFLSSKTGGGNGRYLKLLDMDQVLLIHLPSISLMWVKQCHFYHSWLGMVNIPPIKMVMTGGWLMIVLPTLTWKIELFSLFRGCHPTLTRPKWHPYRLFALPSWRPFNAGPFALQLAPCIVTHNYIHIS